jgi:hypothetical protein
MIRYMRKWNRKMDCTIGKAKRYDLEKHDIMILAGNSALALGFLAQTFETVLGHMGER